MRTALSKSEFLEIGQCGCQNIQHFMLIPGMKENITKKFTKNIPEKSQVLKKQLLVSIISSAVF
jgi:hypothetical protein